MKTSSDLVGRLGGIAAMLGGVLWMLAVAGLTYAHGLTESPRGALVLGFGALTFNRLLAFPPLLFAVGLAGVRARGSTPRGWLGKTGFVVALAGLVMASLGVVLETWIVNPDANFYSPVVQAGWMVSILGLFPVLAVGMVLFGLASSYTKRHLRIFVVSIGLVASLQFVAGVLSAAPTGSLAWDLVAAILNGALGLAWAVLGYVLWFDGDEAARRSTGEASKYPASAARGGFDPSARFTAQRLWR
jgi:hypothetical protein